MTYQPKHRKEPTFKYEVEFMESERGWGQNYWKQLFDTVEDAREAIATTNSRNTSTRVPDYYIRAFEEIRTVEVDSQGNPC